MRGDRIRDLLTMAALVLSCLAVGRTLHQEPRVAVIRGTLVGEVAPRASKSSWAGLGQDKTVALGEALLARGQPNQVTLYCDSLDCDLLMHDLDDAFQIAGWPTEFERAHVDAESDSGLSVGPPGALADAIAALLIEKAGFTPIQVRVVAMSAPGIIIGKNH